MSLEPARLPLILFCLALSGCGGDFGPAVVAPGTGAPSLIHTPPIRQLSDQQLRSLSMECEKYPVDKTSRGPYDAAYCESAMAAWSDAPLQMIPLKKND
jgi:hypothetical protein